MTTHTAPAPLTIAAESPTAPADMRYVNPAAVVAVIVDDTAPAHMSATGYGSRIPTAYRLTLTDGRTRRVYAMSYGNGASFWVSVGGAVAHLGTDVEHALEAARDAARDTADTLPAGGVVRVYVTAERITSESAEHGDAAERGWVNRIGSADIYDSRNDVSPLFEANVTPDGLLIETRDVGGWDDAAEEGDASARDTLRDILAQLGAFHTDTGATLYAEDAQTLDYASDSVYLYAVHAHVKFRDPARGWVEDDVDMVTLSALETVSA